MLSFFMLAFANILAASILSYIRTFSSIQSDRIEILAVANLLASFIGFVVHRSRRANLSRRNVITLVFTITAWALSYALTYGAFVVLAHEITLAQLYVGQSIAPAIAAFLSGDVKRSIYRGREALYRFSPVVSLFAIAFIEMKAKESFGSRYELLAFAVILLLFVASQVSARIVARLTGPEWAQPRLAALNFSFLMVGVFLFTGRAVPLVLDLRIYIVAILGGGIALLQWAYLFGIRSGDPVTSALGISTSVPIGVLMDMHWTRERSGLFELSLALFYVALVHFQASRSRNNSIPSNIQAQLVGKQVSLTGIK